MKNIVLILLLILPLISNAQTAETAVSLRVKEQRAKTPSFQKPSLFQFGGHTKSANLFSEQVAEGHLLTLDLGGLKALHGAAPEALELVLPTGPGSSVTVELVKHDLLTDDFALTTSGTGGQPVPYQPGAYYRGTVKGAPGSLAAISIFEDEVIGVLSTQKDGNMVLGRIPVAIGTGTKSASYIFYKEEDLLFDSGFACEAGEEPVAEGKDSPAEGNEKVEKCVRAYLEAEYDLVNEKGGATPAANYVTGIFNVVATLYQNEAITTLISQVFTWTTADSYATNSTSAALTSFRTGRPSYNGNVAILISRGAPTGGGIAWVDALCTSYAYAYCYVNSTYSNFPTYSWSVNVVAHEMGHVVGSPHTHACSWNGNNTAIDGCGPTAGYSEGCTAPLPTGGGTQMSYCHLVSGVGINFNNGFGTQPGNKLRNEVTGASCLTTCATQCLTVTSSGLNVSCNGGNNGTATATATGGTGSYTYAWSNGGNTQTISNLAAGTYTVTVSSGTNCTGTAQRVVTAPAVLAGSTSVTHATSGQNNGAINLTTSGGTPAYSFLWSNNATTEDLSGLAPGTYTVTITDSKGCTATKSATVNNNTAMSLSFAVTNATSGQNNGAVNMTVSNGTAPFTYAWSNNATTEDLANVPAGTYYVTVTSAVSGTATGSAVVGTNSGGCASFPHAQSFENNSLGSWTQATNDQMNWTLRNSATPTANTGPDAAFNGTYYAYTEATGNINKTAFLLSPCFNIAGVNTFSMSFNYHMYGAKTGTLRIEYSINNSSTWNIAWTKSGNQSTAWLAQTLNFTNNGGSTIKFRVYAKTGNGETSDIGVDNFNIIQTGNFTDGNGSEASIVLSPDAPAPGTLLISPNPASGDELTIGFEAEQEQPGTLTISDQTGRPLRSMQVNAAAGTNTIQMRVAELPAGLYFLQLETATGRRTERFVVLR